MKTLLAILTLGATLLSFGPVQANTLGVDLTGRFPDIFFDTNGTIDYVAATDKLELRAQDRTLTFGDSSVVDLDPLGVKINMAIDIFVDSMTEFGALGTFTEALDESSESITIEGVTYNPGDVILQGDIFAFGSLAVPAAGVGVFDFLATNVTGLFIDNGLWPAGNVGIVVLPDPDLTTVWDGSFDADFHFAKAKGDKAPIPEPATLILLGSGMAVLGLIERRRRKVKKMYRA